MASIKHTTAVIANGQSLSGAIFAGGCLVRLHLPASWTAADLTFQIGEQAADGTITYRNLYDAAGEEVTVEADASRAIRLDPSQWVDPRWFKIRSGTAGSPVAQGGERSIGVEYREVQ